VNTESGMLKLVEDATVVWYFEMQCR